MQVILDSPWTLLSPGRVEPLYGAGRKESSGTGLLIRMRVCSSRTFINGHKEANEENQ